MKRRRMLTTVSMVLNLLICLFLFTSSVLVPSALAAASAKGEDETTVPGGANLPSDEVSDTPSAGCAYCDIARQPIIPFKRRFGQYIRLDQDQLSLDCIAERCLGHN